MLAIRLQRVGRKGAPIYRVIAQDSHCHPSSGSIAANLGTYNPHDKTVQLDGEKISFYLSNGARPTSRVVRLLMVEKIKLPEWVEKLDTKKKIVIKNPEKLRRNRPEEPKAAEPEAVADEVAETPEQPTEASETSEETPAEEQLNEETKAEVVEAPTETAPEGAEASDEVASTPETETAEETLANEDAAESVEEVTPETEAPTENTKKEA